MNRKKVTLAILVLLLILAIVYSVLSQPRQKKAATLKYPGGAAVSQTGAKASGEPKTAGGISQDDKKLHLEVLDKELSRFAGFKRNIFAPVFHEEVKEETRPTGRIKLPVPPPPPPLRPVPPVPPPVAQPEPTPVQRDMARFTFLGFLKKDNAKTIFLSSDKEIFLVKKGDTIAGKYQVANLTEDALTIRPLADGGEIVIPLVENKSLAAPKR